MQDSYRFIIDACDLSPIQGVGDEEDAWLRSFAKRAAADSLRLRLSGRESQEEPIVHFDASSGHWWTGRYIGEVAFDGGVLRILPRYGVLQLQRWMSRIWGVRIHSSKGRYESSQLWLWELLAKLWEARLLAASRHGLPMRRVDESHRGPTIRGRLDVRATSIEMGRGRLNLVSSTRNRAVDRDIASVLLCAFENLRFHLRHVGSYRSWLTRRAQSIVDGMQTQYGPRVAVSSAIAKRPIRYTPITEIYRPVVDLSLAIIQKHPMSSSASGQRDVMGVLIDMAEVWELYLYQLLKASLIDVDVKHAGRDNQNEDYLLKSEITGDKMGGLKPDLVIRRFGSNRILVILDAKYKNTTRCAVRPHGVHREDLYQMNAYLSAAGGMSMVEAGGLIYPIGSESSAIHYLQEASPWKVNNAQGRFWFLGVDCGDVDLAADGLTRAEAVLVERVRGMIQSSRKPARH